MYCSKCGKEIESGYICNECAMAESGYAPQQPQQPQQPQPEVVYQTVYTQPVYAQPAYSEPVNTMPEPKNRMYGFGKALTSVILSFVDFIFAYIGIIFSAVLPESGLALTIVALPLIIIPMVLGTKSIKLFNARKATCVKPIATLACGIAGLSMAAISAFMALMSLIISASMI